MVLIFFKELSKNRKWSEIPFLLITAEKERDKVIEAVQAGIKDYLVKPVKPENLSDKIKEVVFGGGCLNSYQTPPVKTTSFLAL